MSELCYQILKAVSSGEQAVPDFNQNVAIFINFLFVCVKIEQLGLLFHKTHFLK